MELHWFSVLLFLPLWSALYLDEALAQKECIGKPAPVNASTRPLELRPGYKKPAEDGAVKPAEQPAPAVPAETTKPAEQPAPAVPAGYKPAEQPAPAVPAANKTAEERRSLYMEPIQDFDDSDSWAL